MPTVNGATSTTMATSGIRMSQETGLPIAMVTGSISRTTAGLG